MRGPSSSTIGDTSYWVGETLAMSSGQGTSVAKSYRSIGVDAALMKCRSEDRIRPLRHAAPPNHTTGHHLSRG